MPDFVADITIKKEKPGRVAYLNARLLDPASGMDVTGGLLADGETISALGPDVTAEGLADDIEKVDCTGLCLAPGLVDMRAHLREPGFEHKETMADGSVASNVVGLSGVGVAQGLSDKGYIYTDRSAYRAGQLVHVRGVLRRVAGDTYQVEEGSEWKVSVYDPRSRLLWQDDATLNAFGSFHCHFALPAGSPQGEYRIQVQDREGRRAYQGGFLVHEYNLPTVRLEVDTPRRVYYRGEKIEGTIKASFYYGAPLIDRELRYQLAGGRTITVRTDKQGEAKFTLATEDYRETQVLPLVVTLTDPGLQTSTNFVLATHGYSLSLETVRPVYLAGETFETTIRATDAEGKPAGRQITLNVLERTHVDGKAGERLVEKQDLTTDEKSGEARVTLKLPKGAHYILRVEGIDRFKNPITGQHHVQISGDDDRVRLRILAERHTYKAGDEAKITLHWREKPALALVTFQGAKVLDYRLVELKTGANELPIEMAADLAPNFELGVAVMTDARRAAKADPKEPIRRYHTAASAFRVERELLVKVETRRAAGAKGPIRPGENVNVVITTTDPQGRPVAAEVSLAMVEQALMDRFPRRVSAVDDFFRGAARQAAVRTTSSVVFAYRPTTHPINPRLLAEGDRLEREEEEQRLLALLGDLSRATGTDDFTIVAGVTADPRTRMNADEEVPTTTAGVHLRGQRAEQLAQIQAQLESLPPEQRAAAEQYFRRLSESGNADRNGSGQALVMHNGPGPGYVVNGAVDGRKLPRQKEAAVFYSFNSVEQSSIPFDGAQHWSMPVTEHDGRLLTEFAKNYRSREVGVIQRDGGWFYTNLADMDKDEANETAQRLAAAGGLLLPGLAPQETGYWNPAITTGEKGIATIQLTLPERSTAWSLHAKGISVTSLAGEANADLVAKKHLFGELKLPLAMTDGDDARIVCSVHNTAIKKGKITVMLKTTIGDKSVVETKTVDAKDGALQELEFAAKIARPADLPLDSSGPDTAVTFELTIAAGEAKDVLRRSVPIQPFGMRVFRTASGSAQGDTSAWVELPAEMPVVAPSLQIVLGPTVEQSLLDVVLGAAPWCQVETSRFASGLETSTSDLMASLALLELPPGVRYKRILLKLSGEALMGSREYGLDAETVTRVSREVAAVSRLGVEICLVIGGGNIYRGLSGAAGGMERASADYMGMLATIINALAMQNALENQGVNTRVLSAIPMAAVCEPYIRRRAVRHMEKGRVVIFAAGTGNPYFTTDTAAALRASEMGCDALLKATKVDGVYSADPVKVADAKRFERLSYHEVLTRDLEVMDHSAISLARENHIPILVFSIHQPGAFAEVVHGRGRYTLISDED